MVAFFFGYSESTELHTMHRSLTLALCVTAILFAPQTSRTHAKSYRLVPYGPVGASHSEIIGGTITTDGTLGNELDPSVVITDWDIALDSDETGTVRLHSTNSTLTSLGTFDFSAADIATSATPEIRLLAVLQPGVAGVFWGTLLFPTSIPFPSVELKNAVQMSLGSSQVELLSLNSGSIPVATIPAPTSTILPAIGDLFVTGWRVRLTDAVRRVTSENRCMSAVQTSSSQSIFVKYKSNSPSRSAMVSSCSPSECQIGKSSRSG